ncbi:MAG: diguanylate cyclase [Blastocatellia bacterium]
MKVLIAEDDPLIRHALQHTLRRMGHQVTAVENGAQALTALETNPCRMIVTDWVMPDVDGIELCRRIRQNNDPDYTYIILLTVRNDKKDIIEGMEAGADAYMTKPFDLAELEARVQAGERVLMFENSLKERTRLIEEINHDLRWYVQKEQLLRRVNFALNESLDPQVILQTAAMQLQVILDVSCAFTMLRDTDSGRFTVTSEYSPPGTPSVREFTLPLTILSEQRGRGQRARDNRMLMINDLELEAARLPQDISQLQSLLPGARSLVLTPIICNDDMIGLVGLIQRNDSRYWKEEEISLVDEVSRQLSIAVTHAQLYQEVAEQAVRDGLTGLYNRRYFDQFLIREFERARRFGHIISLVLLDLDHLKIINDLHGHQTGDTAIREIGQTLGKRNRRIDCAARFGGEEFAVILVESPVEGAVVAAEKWRSAINEINITEDRKLSVSIGVAAFPDHASTPEELIHKADMALYRAKKTGRNRICMADNGKSIPATDPFSM